MEELLSKFISDDMSFWLILISWAIGAVILIMKGFVTFHEWRAKASEWEATTQPEITDTVQTARVSGQAVFTQLIAILLVVGLGAAAIVASRYYGKENQVLQQEKNQLFESNETLLAQINDQEDNASVQIAALEAQLTSVNTAITETPDERRIQESVQIISDSYIDYITNCGATPETEKCIDFYSDIVDYYIDATKKASGVTARRNDQLCSIYSRISYDEQFSALPEDIQLAFTASWSGCPVLANQPTPDDGKVRG